MKSVRKSTIVFASVIMLSLMMSLILLGNRVEAKDLGNGSVSVEYDSIEEYYGKKAPAYANGYIFAGWYEDEECNTSYVKQEGQSLDKYYAKFVPETVLSVKVQNANALLNTVLTDDATGQIRFATSVDSLNYKEVGFHIEGQIGTVALNKDYSIGKVYTFLYETGTEDKAPIPKRAADVFGTPASEWFAAQVFKINLGQFDDDFTVTPYWVTPDGVRVDGVQRTRNMVDNLEASSYAEVNHRAYYTSNDIFQIATAMNQDGTKEKIWVGEETATMTVLKNVVISGQTSFDGTTTITNKAGKGITIQTAAEWNPESEGACLLFTGGNTLIVDGTSSEAGITINGKSLNETYSKSLVRNNSTFQASNVTFINGVRSDNVNGGGIGGAINATGSTSTIINSCVFTDNHAVKDGGAIYVTNGTLQITDAKFENNYSELQHGGAIFAGAGAKVVLTVSSEQSPLKSFTNNNAVANSGGAIMVNGANAEASVTGYTFTGNNAKTMGGAIRFNEGASFKTESCIFKSNKVENDSTSTNAVANGGAIYAQKAATVTKCTFESNSVSNTVSANGGAIYSAAGVTVEGGTFTGNNATTNGGAIYAKANATIVGGTYTGNNAKINGGAVYVTTGSLKLSNSTVEGNYTTTGHGGAVAVMNAQESLLLNTKFYGNETQGSGAGGGALHVTSATCNVSGCEFGKENAPNKAKTYGGAIYVTAATGIVNLIAGDNSRNRFNYNEAVTGGGAVAVRGNGNASVEACDFTANKATTQTNTNDMKYGGGAIWAEGKQTTVANSTFIQNEGNDGGAIQARSSVNAVTVTNCTFEENSSTHRGAAICVPSSMKGIEITDSKFIKNSTKGHGGAIFANAGLDISNCEFNSNDTQNSGYGGAIDQEVGTGIVKNSVFYGNRATTGGAVASTGGTLTLTDCDFNKTVDGSVVGNTATNGGATGATGGGQIIIKIEDGKSRSLTGNTATKGNLYAQNGASIQYSALYTEVDAATGGNPVGTVTQLEN